MRFTRCHRELGSPRASVPSSLFLHICLILLPRCCQNLRSPLCRFASPAPTHIVRSASARSASAPLSLISFLVLPATCLQQDVCRRLILGYKQWYFISTDPTPSLLQYHVHYANSLNVRWRRVMPFPLVSFSISFNQTACETFFRVRRSRRLHHRLGCRWQVARLCVPHVRRSRVHQCSHDPGTLPGQKGHRS
ncbi:hypothetical protein EDB83DRAFT_2409835 [Lactarius deliciosus]|nr:hypothetical protein EDB83DRAFT_2409835 [Lactarius deliciosus]